jgi:hypothetical protein
MRTTTARGTSSDKERLYPQVYGRDNIAVVWEEVEPLLQKSVEVSRGMITLERIKNLLAQEEAVAFCTLRDNKVQAVLVTQIIQYCSYRSARIIACAGRELRGAMEFISVLDAWAMSQGAVEIEGWCRPEMVRLTRRLGWKEKFVCVTRDLRRTLQ